MKTRTKAELKQIAHEALVSEYGFAPAMNNIILLEANGEAHISDLWLRAMNTDLIQHCSMGMFFVAIIQ